MHIKEKYLKAKSPLLSLHSSIQLGHSEAYNTNKQMPEKRQIMVNGLGCSSNLTTLQCATERNWDLRMHFRVYFTSFSRKQTSPKRTNSQQRTTTLLSPMCAVSSLKLDLTPITIILLYPSST